MQEEPIKQDEVLTLQENFQRGKVLKRKFEYEEKMLQENQSQQQREFKKRGVQKRNVFSMEKLKSQTKEGESEKEEENADFEIAKHTNFLEEMDFFVIELQVAVNVQSPIYRISIHQGKILNPAETGEIVYPNPLQSKKEIKILKDLRLAEDYYAFQCQQLENQNNMMKKIKRSSNLRIGSDLLITETIQMQGLTIETQVQNLVGELFLEANAELAATMNSKEKIPTVSQIEEGEGNY